MLQNIENNKLWFPTVHINVVSSNLLSCVQHVQQVYPFGHVHILPAARVLQTASVIYIIYLLFLFFSGLTV